MEKDREEARGLQDCNGSFFSSAEISMIKVSLVIGLIFIFCIINDNKNIKINKIKAKHFLLYPLVQAASVPSDAES